MKLKDLTYLVAVSKTLHFGKAAEATHVSQPTLSVQLKKLEERLGIVLVERNNKNVRLTPAGKVIAEKAASIFQEIEAIKAYASTMKDPKVGDLKVGIIPTLGPYLLPKAIQVWHAEFPKLSLWLYEAQTSVLLEQLQQGDLDVAILSLPIDQEHFTTLTLFEEPFYFAAHVSHALAKKKSVSSEEIQNEKILLLTEGHCLREQALAVCHHTRHAHMGDFEATSLETLRQMVAQNLGCTLMPELAVQVENPIVVYIPFKKPVPNRKIVMVFRKTHVRSALFKEMASLLLSFLQDC